MKKLLSLLLALVIVLSAFMGLGFTVAAEDADTLAVTVNGVTTNVKVGHTFSYTYTLSDMKILCVEAVVNFDSDFVSVKDVSEDDEEAYEAFIQTTFPVIYGSAVCNTDLDDTILYNYSTANGVRFSGEQVLATFEFTALAAGETTIDTEIVEMADENKDYYVDKTPSGSEVLKDWTYNEYVTYDPTEQPTEPVKPIKVENITVEPASSTAVLSWDAVEGATKYWIYKEKDGNYTAYTSSTSTNATVGGLEGNTTYKVKVIATFEDGTMQKLSDATVVEFTTTAPVVVDGLVATTDVTSVHLSWNAVDGAQKYWIYKAFEENGPFYVYDATTDLEYTVKRLQPDTTYYFKVVPAILQNGLLALGEADAAQELEATTASGEVITTVITDVTSTTATISWPEFENAEKYWVIFSTDTKSTSDLSKWTTWAETTDTTYTFKWREPTKYYFFSVVALYTDAETGTQETVNYIADGARMLYSDSEFITFTPVDEDTVTLTWPEDTGMTKVWVSYYDEDGNEVIVKSTETNTATLDLANYENYSFGLNALDSTGNVGYLTPAGGEAYHN